MIAEKIARAVQEQKLLLETFEQQGEALARFAGRLADSFHQGGRLLLLGSAHLGAIANLIASQFLHRLSLERPSLPVLSLNTDFVLAASLERDGLGQQFFSRQLRMIATPPDIILALAGFHSDETLAEGLTAARQIGCTVALLQPGDNASEAGPGDLLFHLNTASAARAAEGALFFGLLLCELIESEIFGT